MISAQNSHFLRLTFKYCSLIFLFAACNKPTLQQQMLSVFKEKGVKINENTEGVFILDDEGCLTCNRAFGTIISKLLDNQKVNFIVTADANKVDISDYLEKSYQPNILIDRKKTIFKNEFFNHSTILFMSKLQIDTIIIINVNDLEQQMDLVKNKFNL